MADINEKLREAARRSLKSIIKDLLREYGCDPLSKSKDGMTELMWAAYHGHSECVSILLPVSDTLAKDAIGLTALMQAAVHGDEACVSLLLLVSDASAKGAGGLTALMWAAYGGHEVCVDILISKSEALATDCNGMGAGARARAGGYESLAQFIDAYTLAQSERVAIESTVGPVSPPSRVVPRL